jgi:hypothetical protein
MFNKWLIDLTAFIGDGGNIDTGVIPGYDILVSTVAGHTTQISNHTLQIATNTNAIGVHTTQITALSSTSATHTSQIASNSASITANATAIATNATNIASNTSSISTLASRSQVLHGTAAPSAGLGVDGDWFSDTTAKHIYVKVSGAWVLIV